MHETLAQNREGSGGAQRAAKAEQDCYRPVKDVKTDCKEAQARHCQPVGPQARTLSSGAGAASASHMVDNARADVNHGPLTAEKAAARHCQQSKHETASTLPGTASASRGPPARDQHWTTADFDNMRKAELRSSADALGVYTKREQDSKTLQEKCRRAVAPQSTLLRYAVSGQESARAPDLHAASAPPGPASERKAPSSKVPRGTLIGRSVWCQGFREASSRLGQFLRNFTVVTFASY